MSIKIGQEQQVSTPTSSTDIGVLEISWVLWDPTIFKTSLVRPFIGDLSLPGPLNPSLGFLIGYSLRFPILSEEFFIAFAERRSFTGKPCARTDALRPRITTVVSRAYASTVEVFSAVSGRRCPLANHYPQLSGGQIGFHFTSSLDMLIKAQCIALLE